jgi:hypothetical protein
MLRRFGLRLSEPGKKRMDGRLVGRGLVQAGTVLAAGLIAVVVITAGSAATTTKPYTASFDPGPIAAGGTAHVNLAIHNLASPQPLGSANVTAPSAFTLVGATLPQGSATVASGSLLQLRDMNLAPGATLNVDITVRTTCTSGSYTWAILAKQSNGFNGPPGNDFILQTAGSNLVTSVSGNCRLVWDTQPKSAFVNTLITGTAVDTGGPPVAVKAVDGDGNTLQSASGTVTLTKTAGTFSSAGGFTGTQASLVNGVATFSSLTSSATGDSLKLRGSSPGFVSTLDSGAFDIIFAGISCTLGDDCMLPGVVLDTKTSVDSTATGGAFTFLSVTPYTVPPNVTAPGGGCANFQTTGAAGFVQGGDRVSDNGDLLFTYYVDKRQIQKRYGNNNGQQFIPLCAGAARVDASGNVVPCTAQGVPYAPWQGEELNAEGKFDGNLADAVCDPATGLYWAVMGSFQDHRIDPNLNPTVTGWDSDTLHRFFTMRVPSPWDWRVGG